MLAVLMYHRITHSEAPYKTKNFAAHLTHLVENYPLVIPGDPLARKKLSLCLTFDDAYFDFYHIVYPLLKKLNVKAVLGVPVKYILENTLTDPQTRLNVPYHQTVQDPIYKKLAPFCTWEEIQEMTASGQVKIASHSFNHIDITQPEVNLTKEIDLSKKILEKKLNTSVDTFIYPFGKMNKPIHQQVKKNYKYAMRIGSSLNFNWQNTQNLIYRISMDNFEKINTLGNRKNYYQYFLRFLSNTVRGK